ncbi:leucine-rich repeat domain-containing protein [Spirosoma oryzicola]|uniref:leucine-rich repeat domain-containing protein n=1 Tax=Spirosoma oryzicola TaxID=2898794 RepID=UPI001E5406FC|nr:leucine-rich repeat domain-containing protein [Spirosoma oryzicola]UHG93020.1 leucine-rich repeat domain-containing protein [Spirosoma oryzicola]
MNYLLTLFFGFLWASGWAQTQVVLLRDTTRLNLSVAQLEKKYSPAFARVAGQQGVFTRQGKLFTDTLNTRTQQFFDFTQRNKKRLPVQGILLQTQEFIRPDGTYELVLCSFSGRDLTNGQESKLIEILTEWYTQRPFPLKTSTGFRWSSMTSFGTIPQRRTVRRGAGIISTLEAAEKTTRPDTVTMLAFNQLELSSVPEIVYRFPRLEELDLSKNNLHELPARLTAAIPTLKRLSLLYNAIPDDSVFITSNKHLVALNLQGNKLTRIPNSVRQNRRLESLWMGNNKLKELDVKTLRSLRRLNDLNLYNAGLTQLPKGIRRLKHVRVLDLYYNKFTELPSQLGKMKRLEQLAVAHNDLKELPKSLTKLHRLQVLYAHHNRLSQLPTAFDKMTNLTVLDLGYNWFSVAPNVLAELPSLEELDLSNNNLQDLPRSLGALKRLKKLHLRSNPLSGEKVKTGPYAPLIHQLEANRTEVFY